MESEILEIVLSGHTEQALEDARQTYVLQGWFAIGEVERDMDDFGDLVYTLRMQQIRHEMPMRMQ